MIPTLINHNASLDVSIASSKTTQDWWPNQYVIGPLDCVSATVHEERNGEYTATIQVPIVSRYYESITLNGLVLLKTPNRNRSINDYSGSVYSMNSLQTFRIVKISKPINGLVTLQCNHISYDLRDKPCGALDMDYPYPDSHMALTFLTQSQDVANPFIGASDIQVNTEMDTRQIPYTSIRSVLGGVEGSFIDVYNTANRGEFEWSNLIVTWWRQRGTDNGVQITYGKDLVDFNLDEELTFAPTAVMGYALYEDKDYNIFYNEHSDVQHGRSVMYPRVLNVDFSEKMSKSDYDATVDKSVRVAKLNNLARNYITKNGIGSEVNFNLKIVAADLKNKDIFREIHLCDTISIVYPKYNFDAKTKVIAYDYDVLNERYISIEVGEPKVRFENVLSSKYTNQAYNKIKNMYK